MKEDVLSEQPQDQPVQTYRQEFLEFIRARDLPCVGTFSSAYPTRTVLDVLDGVAVAP